MIPFTTWSPGTWDLCHLCWLLLQISPSACSTLQKSGAPVNPGQRCPRQGWMETNLGKLGATPGQAGALMRTGPSHWFPASKSEKTRGFLHRILLNLWWRSTDVLFNPLTWNKIWDGPAHSRLWDSISDVLRRKIILIQHILLCNSTHLERGADCFPITKPHPTLLTLWTRSEHSDLEPNTPRFGEISVRARTSLLLWCRNRRKQAESNGGKGFAF